VHGEPIATGSHTDLYPGIERESSASEDVIVAREDRTRTRDVEVIGVAGLIGLVLLVELGKEAGTRIKPNLKGKSEVLERLGTEESAFRAGRIVVCSCEDDGAVAFLLSNFRSSEPAGELRQGERRQFSDGRGYCRLRDWHGAP
jgi:hypothetical protein